MADELTTYRRTLHQIYETAAPDELVQDWVTQDVVEITASGTHKRGLLLMSSGNGFIPATSEGLASAGELCILCSDRDIPEGKKAVSYAYFTGTFKGSSIILGWETKNDDHEALIDEIRGTLRKQKILVK